MLVMVNGKTPEVLSSEVLQQKQDVQVLFEVTLCVYVQAQVEAKRLAAAQSQAR